MDNNTDIHPDTLVIVNQSTGDLTIDVCNAFVGRYRKIIAITGKVTEGNKRLHRSIEVHGIIQYDRSSIISRMISWCLGYVQIRNQLHSIEGPKDVLYFTNPPMSYFQADKSGDRFAIVVYDLYPDVLRNILCPKFIIEWWEKRNKRVFSKCSGVITLSDGMKDRLARYCNPDMISVVPNWYTIDTPEFVPENENPFIRDLGLEGKFIVMFSGNIGYTHSIESLIKVADHMRDDKDVHFLIIGQGGKKRTLLKMARNLALDNVTFHDYLPFNELKYSMNAASLGVVTLTPATANASVPSRIYNSLRHGVPLLNIASSGTEMEKLIVENSCGGSFQPEDIEGISGFIRKCNEDRIYLSMLRTNAREASLRFTPANARKYTGIFGL